MMMGKWSELIANSIEASPFGKILRHALLTTTLSSCSLMKSSSSFPLFHVKTGPLQSTSCSSQNSKVLFKIFHEEIQSPHPLDFSERFKISLKSLEQIHGPDTSAFRKHSRPHDSVRLCASECL
jgi:hypothetical protein